MNVLPIDERLAADRSTSPSSFDNETAQMKKAKMPSSFTDKIAVFAVVAACLVLGAIGLVLPVIPGLLFLAIAVALVIRPFPSLDARLRRHRAIGKQLDRSDAFLELGLTDQIKAVALLSLKMVLDTLAFIAALPSKLR
jgi:uncharacterized membrane protein YbaN (DUF454 family)